MKNTYGIEQTEHECSVCGVSTVEIIVVDGFPYCNECFDQSGLDQDDGELDLTEMFR